MIWRAVDAAPVLRYRQGFPDISQAQAGTAYVGVPMMTLMPRRAAASSTRASHGKIEDAVRRLSVSMFGDPDHIHPGLPSLTYLFRDGHRAYIHHNTPRHSSK